MSRESRSSLSKRKLIHSITAGAFLIGLAILFHIGFWPWILALIGIIVMIEGIGEYYCSRSERGEA